MISQILVPTDFSAVAANALQYALKLAAKAQATVHVLHVNYIPVIDPAFPTDVYQTFMTEMEASTKKGFEALQHQHLDPSGVRYETHSVAGFVADEVQLFTEQHKIDMVVMGTTGASGLQEILVGSNAASVVSKSHVPVLVIPPSARYSELKHIVYASDFNEPEFPAVARLMYLAELYQADISILHVKTEYDRFFDSANHFFERNKDHISYDKWKVVKLPEGDVMEKINAFTDQQHADLLVMAKHNRGFFDRLFHRSLSKHMAYHTRIPLLVLNK